MSATHAITLPGLLVTLTIVAMILEMKKKLSAVSLQPSATRGITLLELLVVMAIVGMIVTISFPSVTSGLDGVRLQAMARRVAAFVNVARGQADREQLAVEIRIDLDRNQMSAMAADGKWERDLKVEEGIRIAGVWPALEALGAEARMRRFIVIPGVPPPRFRVQLDSSGGRSMTVAVDPLTGTPQIERAGR